MTYGTNRQGLPKRRQEELGLETLFVEIPRELKRLAGEKADAEGISLTEYVARLLSRDVARPELAVWGKKRPGRPRKNLSAAS